MRPGDGRAQATSRLVFRRGAIAVEKVEAEPRLADLSTQWNLIFQAKSGTPEQVSMAMSLLMCRYAGAVHRYLLKALKNPDAAEELDQEFAVRFLRGDFRHGDPSRGRFRDYVKRAVQNLMKDYYRRRRRDGAGTLEPGISEPATMDEGLVQFDRQFLQSWRNDLLDRAWGSLEELERSTGQPHYTILRPAGRCSPGLTSRSGRRGSPRKLERRSYSPGAFRQALQRARREFALRLLAEVRASLEEPTPQALEEELADLELLEYCRPYLKQED